MKIDEIVECAVLFCKKRHPVALDTIFDNLPVDLNKQVLYGTVAALKKDIHSLSWLCGYFAEEINRAEDNHQSHLITELSELLIMLGMRPFLDFMPYPGCRIVILDTDKFESLPKEIQATVEKIFNVREQSGEEAQQINDALLQELTVTQE